MTNTPEQTLSDLLALGEKLTPGPWLRDESDTNPGRPAVFADGGITGVAQVAIFPREFTAATENADFLADAKNALPALRSALERLSAYEEAVGEVENAVELALKYWRDRQQRYRNRSPVWVGAANNALARLRALQEK